MLVWVSYFIGDFIKLSCFNTGSVHFGILYFNPHVLFNLKSNVCVDKQFPPAPIGGPCFHVCACATLRSAVLHVNKIWFTLCPSWNFCPRMFVLAQQESVLTDHPWQDKTFYAAVKKNVVLKIALAWKVLPSQINWLLAKHVDCWALNTKL